MTNLNMLRPVNMLSLASVVCCALTLTACQDEERDVTVQVDRMGRAGVNTAITDPFYRASVAAEQARHDRNASDYNGNDDPASWNSEFNAAFQSTLAVLDSLDRNCGNQLLADGADGLAEDRYNLLAAVLADDRLYVNTNAGSCQQYLAVEASAVGVEGLADDCGGRTPLYDVIDTTYSALAIGAFSGVGDGVDFDASSTPSESVFPFLNSPIIVEVIENDLSPDDSLGDSPVEETAVSVDI